MRNHPSAALLLSALLVVGCDGGDDASSATPAAAENANAAPAAPAAKPELIDVEYGLEVQPAAADDKEGTATWSVVVPTGGWKMTTDSVLIEDWKNAPAVRVYVTLEQPAADEMVTQQVQTLKESKSGPGVRKAEFSVRRKIRGVTYDFQPLYSVVKTVPPGG